MRERLIIPLPSDWHGGFLSAAAQGAGLGAHFPTEVDADAIRRGLSLVNNDACFTAVVAVAQAHRAVQAQAGAGIPGESADVCVPMLCPGCRCKDIPFFVERGLREAGLAGVTLHDFNEFLRGASSAEQRCLAHALMAGDLLLQLRLRMRPHLEGPQVPYFDALSESWRGRVLEMLRSGEPFDARSFMRSLDDEAARLLPTARLSKPRVGVAGTAAALFCPSVNGGLLQVLEEEGCEVVAPYLSGLVSYALHAQGAEGTFLEEVDGLCACASEGLRVIPHAVTYERVRSAGLRFVPELLTHGLGWSFAGWMSILVDEGVTDIVYASVFGCLSGHVVGRGVLRRLRRYGSGANIATVEFDPGTSGVNQVNRIKLMAAVARQGCERG